MTGCSSPIVSRSRTRSGTSKIMNDASDTGLLPFSIDLAILAKPDAPGPVWDDLADRALNYVTRAHGDDTLHTYHSACIHFSGWCASLSRDPSSDDPELVATYVVRIGDDRLAVSSIRVALAAIWIAHQLAGVGLFLSQPRF